MKGTYIRLEYKGLKYEGHKKVLSPEEIDEVHRDTAKISEGKHNHLTFSNGGEKYYFCQKVLEESVITVITE